MSSRDITEDIELELFMSWTSPHSKEREKEKKVPVKRHRGEPGHTRDRHKNLTNQPQNQPHPPTHAPDHTRTPGHTRRPTPHHSPASAVVVTVMATAPGRGSSEGASPTASVTALLRVPPTGRRGGTSKRLRHPRAADRAHGSCPAARTGHDYARCAAREAEDRRPHGVAARPIAGPARLSRWGP